MNQEHENADQPLISQVAEDDEESGETVVKSVLEKVAFGTDENMAKETTKMLTKLQNIEDLHLKGHI